MKYKDFFEDKTILIVGGTGSIGRKMTEILIQYNPKVIRIFSRDEYKQFIMEDELSQYKSKLRFLIGDVRDFERLMKASKGADIIFHLAAMKHVPACEYNPYEAVKTNVIGTQNVVDVAIANKVSHVVLTSSDKAISPTNAMGATKLLAERLISAANFSKGTAKTIFSAVRFGNVMGSRGSVIPLFKKQILEKRKIKITDSNMTRFMMTITQAAKLTIEACVTSKGGEVFVLKMPVLKLGDLAEAVIEEVCSVYNLDKSSITMENMGLRPGEKMYEELMTEEEGSIAYELPNMYAVMPIFDSKEEAYKSYKKVLSKEYSSDNAKIISKQEIHKIIKDNKLISS